MRTLIIEKISDYEWEEYWEEPKGNSRIEQLKKRFPKLRIIEYKK